MKYVAIDEVTTKNLDEWWWEEADEPTRKCRELCLGVNGSRRGITEQDGGGGVTLTEQLSEETYDILKVWKSRDGQASDVVATVKEAVERL